MGGLFSNCLSLRNLPDISKWDIKNVKNINHIFYHCDNLNNIPDI
jgi:surface protein